MSRRYWKNNTTTSHLDLSPTSKGFVDRALLIAGVGSALVPFCQRMSCNGDVTELLRMDVESLNASGMLKHAKNKKIAHLAETYGAAAVQRYLEEQLQKKRNIKFNQPDSSNLRATSTPEVSPIASRKASPIASPKASPIASPKATPKINRKVSRKASLKSSPNASRLANHTMSPIPIYSPHPSPHPSPQPTLKSMIKTENSSTSLSPNKTVRFTLPKKVKFCLNKMDGVSENGTNGLNQKENVQPCKIQRTLGLENNVAEEREREQQNFRNPKIQKLVLGINCQVCKSEAPKPCTCGKMSSQTLCEVVNKLHHLVNPIKSY